ncbi:hypothetical protein [Brevibacillus laterosporus]|uniref:hypothetical protein n=1 Tax=Brevibacillus laterosporus TaxID=1465 RepID=UPI003D22A777
MILYYLSKVLINIGLLALLLTLLIAGVVKMSMYFRGKKMITEGKRTRKVLLIELGMVTLGFLLSLFK